MHPAVVVVGAGPVGLLLAGELRLAGVDVTVLERLAEPTGESRGLGFTARTMESLDQRGLLDRFGGLQTSPRGHFGGIPIDFSILPGAFFAAGVPQWRTERALTDWATELGADLRRGWELISLTNGVHGVDVEVATPDGVRQLQCDYLVGCDGGRSTVRRLAGFDFAGTSATIEMFLADVAGCDLRPRPIGEGIPGGMVMAAPLGDGVDRIIVCERGAPPQRRTEPPAFAEVADAWQRLTGEDIRHGTPRWVSAFGDATRQATEYRRGRVLLAGDAAHVHLPAGGQGMSVGLQDVVNLGWKLAAVTRGQAPDGLLDSYHDERHPVGARLLTNTRAQGLLVLGDESVQPLREVLRELIGIDEVGRHLAAMISGLDIRYDMGPGRHPLLGRRMPHRELIGDSGKTSTTELLHGARGVLLDLTGAAGPMASGYRDRVDVVSLETQVREPQVREPQDPLAGVRAVLVRPDGYVAWVDPDGGDLPTALRRWFGAPSSGTSSSGTSSSG
jgi:bifunctional hydroxylase/dehydrase